MRLAMEAPSTDSPTHCLEVDHRNLDAVLLECERSALAGKFADASGGFAAFSSGLVRHIEAEEHVLFPALEAVDRGATGPTSVMRAEHAELRQLLDDVAGELAASAAGWQTLVSQLKELLLAHNVKEERVLYPMADEAARRTASGSALAERLRNALVAV